MRRERAGKKDKSSGLRVVLDTNVLVSAFTHPEGRILFLWQQARQGHYQLLTSPAIVHEVARILRHIFAWEEVRVSLRMRELVRVSEVVIPSVLPEAVPDDPDDNHILACALAGQAGLIVSGDKHLRRLKAYQGIPIVRPADFLHTLEGF